MKPPWPLQELSEVIAIPEHIEKEEKLNTLKNSCEQHLKAKIQGEDSQKRSKILVKCDAALLQLPCSQNVRASGKCPIR